MRAQASSVCHAERSASSGTGLTVRAVVGTGALMVVEHPRSVWMRSVVEHKPYMQLAAAADWSGHQGTSVADPVAGRIPRAAKAVAEADRCDVADEAGYCARLMKLLHQNVGIRNDLLVGFPLRGNPLGAHLE